MKTSPITPRLPLWSRSGALCALLALSQFPAAIASPVVGVNFTGNWPTPRVAGETAAGTNTWVDLGPAYPIPYGDGTILTNTPFSVDTHLTFTLFTANSYAAGLENDSEQQIYRMYLDDGDGGGSYAPNDGIGVSVEIEGLDAWMAANGLTGYIIRAFRSTDAATPSLVPVIVREGVPPEGGALADLPEIGVIGLDETGDGGFQRKRLATSAPAVTAIPKC